MKNKPFVTEGESPLNEVKIPFDSGGMSYDCTVAAKISPDIVMMHLMNNAIYYRKARSVNKTLPMSREIKRAMISKFSTGAGPYRIIGKK